MKHDRCEEGITLPDWKPCKRKPKFLVLFAGGSRRLLCNKHTLNRKRTGAFWQIVDLKDE